MAAHQQMLRVDRESNKPLAEAEYARLLEKVDAQVDNFEVIILSDYGKGVISEQFLAWFSQRRKKGRRSSSIPKRAISPSTPTSTA